MTVQYLPIMEFVSSVFIPDTDSDRLLIFNDEKERAGLANKDISLLVLENGGEHRAEIASVDGNKEEGYTCVIDPEHPDVISERGTVRKQIRHELAHIKYGDLERSLPKGLETLYKWLIKEPRATLYSYGLLK